MQQEQVIQQKQQAIDDLVKQVTELKKQAELVGIESRDLRQVNSTLKNKLEEVQESLKSNENLIQYLNKQLNEKANAILPGVISGQSTQSSLGGKLNSAVFTGTIPIGGKPPTAATFKPSFGSVEQMNYPATLGRSNSKQSFDRPASPSAFSQRSITSFNASATGPVNDAIPSLASSRTNKSFATDSPTQPTQTSKLDLPRSSNEPSRQFVSKYTKMAMEQQS
jgi:hypothetical protein